MSKKVITFGEIMLRLATPDYLRFCQAFAPLRKNWQANCKTSVTQ